MDAQTVPAKIESQGGRDEVTREFVRRDELARALVEMLDDEIRALKMRIGVLEARRKRIVRQMQTT